MTISDPGPGVGRRRAQLAERRRRTRRGVVAGLVALVVLAGGVGAATLVLRARAAGTPADDGAADAAVDVCTESSLKVVATPDVSPVVTRLAEQLRGEAGEEGCAAVAVEARGSAEVAEALAEGWNESEFGARPDVWIPSSSAFVELVRASPDATGVLPGGAGAPVARSPTVLGMPRPLAEALGWPGSRLGWNDVLDLVAEPEGWAARGHPEWGPFRFGLSDPASSAAGLHALLSIGAARTGVWTDALSGAGLADVEVRRTLLTLDRSVAERSASVNQQLLALRQADREGRGLTFLSALPLSERDVWRYNQGALTPGGPSEGPPATPLVALYPPEGGLSFDYPFQVLAGADERRAGALLDLLLGDDAQRRFQEDGFRDAANRPGDVLAAATEGLRPERAGAEVPVPAGDAVRTALGSWRAVSQRGVTLNVMDVSGSMKDLVPGTQERILDLAARSAQVSLELYREDSIVGLWQFSTGLPGCPQDGDYCELVPLGPMGEDLGGATRRDRMAAALDGLQPTNDTALYDTILAAYDTVQAAHRPDEFSTVIVFTDGRSDGDQLTLDALLTALRERADPARPVQLGLIAYGGAVDRPALEAIVGVTGGEVFTPATVEEIDEVFLRALTGV
jgi:Ca-activated chloride channel family protein